MMYVTVGMLDYSYAPARQESTTISTTTYMAGDVCDRQKDQEDNVLQYAVQAWVDGSPEL